MAEKSISSGSDDSSSDSHGLGVIKLVVVKKWPTESIIELYKQAAWWQESSAARDAIPKMIAGSFLFIVAIEDGKTVGMGRVIADSISDGYIQDVTVLTEYRRRKIGAALIKALSKEAVKRGIVWLGLIAEPGTTEFYKQLGFRPLEGFVPMRLPTPEIP